jgi:phospholipid-binding lipoprotein MlaA
MKKILQNTYTNLKKIIKNDLIDFFSNIKFFQLYKNILILVFGIFISYSNITFAQEYEDDFFELEDDGGSSNLVINDPFEKFNRKIFIFNEKADKYFMRPVNKAYRFIMPKFVRTGIGNFVNNLSRPFDVINSVIQGDFYNARGSFSSFLINSTIGLFGLFDIAKYKEIDFEETNFGDSFAHYNIKSGPYLVLPFLGPSNVRNFSGFLVEKAIDPLSFDVFEIAGKNDLLKDNASYQLAIIQNINKYDEIADLLHNSRKDSFDLYATMRVAYLQSQN